MKHLRGDPRHGGELRGGGVGGLSGGIATRQCGTGGWQVVSVKKQAHRGRVGRGNMKYDA